MGWLSDYYGTGGTNKGWNFSAFNSGYVRQNFGAAFMSKLKYVATNYNYKNSKTYILRTDVKNFYEGNGALDVSFPFGITTSFTASATKVSSIFNPGNGYTSNILTELGRHIPSQNDQYSTIISIYSPTSSPSWGNTFSTKRAVYSALYNNFDTSYILGFELIELDWRIQGYTIATSSNFVYNRGYEGWRYFPEEKKFEFRKSATSNIHRRLPSGSIWKQTAPAFAMLFPNGLWQNDAYTKTNYVSKFIGYEKFNLEFSFYKNGAGGATQAFVDIYLTPNFLPDVKFGPISGTSAYASFQQALNNGQFLGRIEDNGTYSFYNLTGNTYLNFVANYDGDTEYTLGFSDVTTEGGYSEPDNNIQLPFTTTNQFYSPTQLSVIGTTPEAEFNLISIGPNTQHLTTSPSGPIFNGPTGSVFTTSSGLNFEGFFSPIYGTVTNLSLINSKVGNGTFRAGIWENGVWNSGWRVDEEDEDFDSVIYAFSLSTENKRWRIQIKGSTYSTAQFEIGDKVSVGNIVAIDINEQRKLLKNYFTVVNKTTTDLVVEVDNFFPIRRIEKDSENHKIKITRNVWLNGAFLNGMFQGVWNNGLFKGFPVITEMYNSHWIDGSFDGGHLYSGTIEYDFIDTNWLDGNVGLKFATGSQIDLIPGDLIEIYKDDSTVNPQYNGSWIVTEIFGTNIIKTNIPWGINTTDESGRVIRKTKTGVIQNFKFKDNNVAKFNLKSVKGGSQSYIYSSADLEKIWKFNSWIDVNYTTYSTTYIGRNKISFNESPQDLNDFGNGYKYGLGEFSEANLYGYTTEDVLSSESLFRDIDSQVSKFYSLGTKYEIYEDYIGDASNFDLPFNSGTNSSGLNNFFGDGWTFSFSGSFGYFNDSFKFDDNIFYESKFGFVGLTGVDLRPGDRIYVDQDAGFTWAQYNGITNINKVIATNSGPSSPFGFIPNNTDYYIYVTNKPFQGASPIDPGRVVYTKRAPIGYTISRTIDSTLRVEQPNAYVQSIVLKSSNITIPKRRYSVVEFDLVDYENSATNSVTNNATGANVPQPTLTEPFDPIILFNVGKIPQGEGSIAIAQGGSYFSNVDAFPEVPDIDSRFLGRKNKTYYFNRLNLNLGLYSLGGYNIFEPGFNVKLGGSFVELDNIKFYEVDMIPFFKYTTEDFVNKEVQIPYVGQAPYINYEQQGFSFVDNILIGYDSFQLTSSYDNIVAAITNNVIFIQPFISSSTAQTE